MIGIANPFNFIAFSITTLSLGIQDTGVQQVIAQAVNQPSIAGQVQEVATFLTGSMSTTAQAMKNPNVSNVRLVTCPVLLTPSVPPSQQAVYLYQEQALVTRPGKPYRQRFLRIAPAFNQQSVQSLAFKPSELGRWVGLCERPISERTVSLSEMGQPVCSIFLKKVGSDYIGRTPADGCPATYRGAVRITNRVLLNQQGMETWDRGFDTSGQQVWGADNESYKFQRLDSLAN